MKEQTIHQILSTVQRELKVPKGNYNSFGKYKYRSCEDILEAIKEVLPEGSYVTLGDELIMVGNRFYIKARATFHYANDCVTTEAIAREPQEQKGMSESQVTGTASSYARKYALNGLFAIDDTKDADTDEFRNKGNVLNTEVRDEAKLAFLQQVNGKLDSVTSFKDLDSSLTKEEKEYLKTKLSKIDPIAYKNFRDRYASLEAQFRKMAEEDLLNKYKEA